MKSLNTAINKDSSKSCTYCSDCSIVTCVLNIDLNHDQLLLLAYAGLKVINVIGPYLTSKVR